MKRLKQSLGKWFNTSKAPILGAREIDVLKTLWHSGQQSAHSVHKTLTDANISLSTVQSTLERLHRKEVVSREKVGRYFVYQAKVDQSALVCDLLRDITEHISDGNMAPVISGFMDFMAEASEQDTETLQAITDNRSETTQVPAFIPNPSKKP